MAKRTYWRHTIRAEDGTHHHLYPTEGEALDAMAENAGFDREGLTGRERVDDWGRSHYVEECPPNITTALAMTALGEAYDARECGTATAAQVRLLERSGW